MAAGEEWGAGAGSAQSILVKSTGTLGWLCVGTTRQAVQFVTQMFKPSLWRCYPVPMCPWRIMSNMLPMPTLKLSNPIQVFIQMKINDFSHHPVQSCLHGFHRDSLRP